MAVIRKKRRVIWRRTISWIVKKTNKRKKNKK